MGTRSYGKPIPDTLVNENSLLSIYPTIRFLKLLEAYMKLYQMNF